MFFCFNLDISKVNTFQTSKILRQTHLKNSYIDPVVIMFTVKHWQSRQYKKQHDILRGAITICMFL